MKEESSDNREGAKGQVPRRSRAASIWAIFGGLTVLLVAGFACFYFMMSRATKAPIEQLAQTLSTVFGTEVNVSGSTAVLEKSEIEELAVVQRKTQAIVKYETIWMGSSKVLIVRGDFLVKAGFELDDGGSWEIINGRVSGKLPQGKVLSVEPVGDFEIYHSDNGTINRLKPQDHANAFNQLKSQARSDAIRSDIGEEAERVLVRRIKDRMNGLGLDVDLNEQVLP